jgi:hypothetical protein
VLLHLSDSSSAKFLMISSSEFFIPHLYFLTGSSAAGYTKKNPAA